jgi:hypothetical protein
MMSLRDSLRAEIESGEIDVDQIPLYLAFGLRDDLVNKISDECFVNCVFPYLLKTNTMEKKDIDMIIGLDLTEKLFSGDTLFTCLTRKAMMFMTSDNRYLDLLRYAIEKSDICRSKGRSLLEFALYTSTMNIELISLLMINKHKTHCLDTINCGGIAWSGRNNNLLILSMLIDNFGVDIGWKPERQQHSSSLLELCVGRDIAYDRGVKLDNWFVMMAICGVEYELRFNGRDYTLNHGQYSRVFKSIGDIKNEDIILGGRSVKSAN